MTRRRILVLTKTTALGGAERLLMNALPYLDRGAFDYRFAALDADGPLAEACRAAGLPFSCLPHARALDPRNVLALRRLLTGEAIDLLHVHLPLTAALARTATRGLPTRLVYTEHNVQQQYRAPSRWLNAATYHWQERVVAVSREVKLSADSHIGGAARERTAVVSNGVDFEWLDREAAVRPAPLPRSARGAFVVLVPASLELHKGHDVLLDALALLRDRPFPPIEVWLAGEGSERAALEARVRALGLSQAVHLLGARSDVFALMARADAVVLPSRHEGHPMALLEALALGRPVLATRVGGVPEIVRSEHTGLLVEPESPASLAGALDRLRCNPALRERLAAAAAPDARRRFDIRRSVAAIESIYARVLSPASAPPATRKRQPEPPRARAF